MELSTQITIDASISETWNVFSRFSDYPTWNPFITAIRGEVEAGNRIEVTMHQPGMNPMTMKPKVLVFENEKEFRWLGRLGFAGLFDGEHVFEVHRNENG